MKVLLKEWVKNAFLKFSKTHSQASKLLLEELGLNIILHILTGNLPDSQPLCHSHFSYTMDHGNSRWMLQANLASDQATSVLKNLLLFVMHFYAFRHWLLTIVLKRNFCHYAKQPWYVLFSTFCSQKSSLKKVAKCFLKLFSFLRYLSFSPAIFGHVGKQLDRKANVISKFMTSQDGNNISSRCNQTWNLIS